ncbi:MAG: hypothetical protein PVI99_02300 [Anaerolineales bacterium]
MVVGIPGAGLDIHPERRPALPRHRGGVLGLVLGGVHQRDLAQRHQPFIDLLDDVVVAEVGVHPQVEVAALRGGAHRRFKGERPRAALVIRDPLDLPFRGGPARGEDQHRPIVVIIVPALARQARVCQGGRRASGGGAHFRAAEVLVHVPDQVP